MIEYNNARLARAIERGSGVQNGMLRPATTSLPDNKKLEAILIEQKNPSISRKLVLLRINSQASRELLEAIAADQTDDQSVRQHVIAKLPDESMAFAISLAARSDFPEALKAAITKRFHTKYLRT